MPAVKVDAISLLPCIATIDEKTSSEQCAVTVVDALRRLTCALSTSSFS
jgi:hypothetical protein